MNIKTYYKAKALEEAYKLLTETKNASIVAGGAWLKRLPSDMDMVIDLSLLELDEIIETKDAFLVGCMTTLKQLEENVSIQNYYDGILSKSIGHIKGIPIRNIATIGGTVAGRFGFSNILTPLLVLDTDLIFYHKGQIPLHDYLKSDKKDKDILINLLIHKKAGKAYFETMKKSKTDFPTLNVAISQTDRRIKIAVGARPSKAKLADSAMIYLERQSFMTETVIRKAANIASQEMNFGSNRTGSKTYRTELCKVLVQRGLKEISNSLGALRRDYYSSH